MRKCNIVAIAAVLGLASLTVGGVHAAEKLKVGFIYLGPIGDLGWTYQHDLGRKAMEKALGDKVETTYLENVPETADAERSIEQLVRTGHKLIFATSFGYMDATLRIANKYPNVFFEHCAGYKRAKNMSSYDRRDYEGRYISGQIAAKMSKTGVIGYIVPFPIPPVIANINAMMLGAQSVRPDVKIKIIWVNTWFDPGKEADAAKALVDQGADILTQHTDSPAPTQIAEQRGILSFGEDTDMIKFGPHAQLTSVTDDWGGYYAKRAQAVIDGTWTSGDTFGGLDSGMVVMSPYTNMPDDVKKMAMDTEAALKSGKLHVFKCPITNQDGSAVECKGGDHLDEVQVRSMNWYVKGIDDKLPAH
jgi:basic membrane protein A and related proteins